MMEEEDEPLAAVDPFAELRRHATSNHPQKKQLNVLLAAVREIVIEQRNGAHAHAATTEPTPVEYFAGIMLALEGGDLESKADLLSLLTLVLPHTPHPPLRAKFQHIAATLMRAGQQFHAAERGGGEGGTAWTAALRHVMVRTSPRARTRAPPTHGCVGT